MVTRFRAYSAKRTLKCFVGKALRMIIPMPEPPGQESSYGTPQNRKEWVYVILRCLLYMWLGLTVAMWFMNGVTLLSVLQKQWEFVRSLRIY